MKLSDLKPGDEVIVDATRGCLIEGPATVEADASGDLFIHCGQGFHYLEGMQGPGGELAGLSPAKAAEAH
jgi:hypothetical protein